MKQIIPPLLAISGLALTLIPSLSLFQEAISGVLQKQLMALGMVLWFLTAPYWIGKKRA